MNRTKIQLILDIIAVKKLLSSAQKLCDEPSLNCAEYSVAQNLRREIGDELAKLIALQKLQANL